MSNTDGSPTNSGSHPIIHTFIGPVVKVVGLITGIVKSDVSLRVLLYGFTHHIGTGQTALHPGGGGGVMMLLQQSVQSTSLIDL
jgi:hypothetical protein